MSHPTPFLCPHGKQSAWICPMCKYGKATPKPWDSEKVKRYLYLEKCVKEIRAKGDGDEDPILDEMDFVWYELTREEINFINALQNE